MTDTDPLARADASASRQGTRTPDDPAVPCRADPVFALEVLVVGEDDQPLADIGIELAKSASAVLRGLSGSDGLLRFEGLAAGTYQASLHELDEEAWEKIGGMALSQPASSGQAAWSSPVGAARAASVHVAAQGECIAQLAEQYGFAPATLWNLPDNSALKEKRDSLYMLYDGADGGEPDRVAIPAPRKKTLPVQTGQRYTLRRIGVPELLDIDFQQNGVPYRDVQYLISVAAADGRVLLDRKGVTNADGTVRQAIPPHAASAEITLMLKGGPRVHRFALGHLNPVDTLSGLRAMLSNLGYPCSGEQGDLGPQTERALAAFQLDHDLPQQGLDDATRAKILAVYSQ